MFNFIIYFTVFISFFLNFKNIGKYYINKDAKINSFNNYLLKYKNINHDDIIKIIFYNSSKYLIVDMKEFEFLEDEQGTQDWFLSLFLKYNKDNKFKKDENGFLIYITDEDYNVIKSLIKSIQYNKLILYENVNINILFEVAKKLCAPINILEIIKKNRNNYNELELLNKNYSKKELIYLKQTFKCKLCKQGFNHLNNNHGDCKYHTNSYNLTSECYLCCGGDITDKGCKIGKHVAEVHNTDIEFIKTLLSNIN